MRKQSDASREHTPRDVRAAIAEALEHAHHLLPDQAPIRVFIHHNTLHAFQHLPFHQAVQEAHRVYGAEPYLSEERYRALLGAGRIDLDDLAAALHDQVPPSAETWLDGQLDAARIRMAMSGSPSAARRRRASPG